MPCLKAPAPTLPTLPAGFGFGAALPTATFDQTLCCKMLPFKAPTPPVALAAGFPVPPPVLAAIAAAKRVLLAYVDQLQVNCPRE